MNLSGSLIEKLKKFKNEFGIILSVLILDASISSLKNSNVSTIDLKFKILNYKKLMKSILHKNTIKDDAIEETDSVLEEHSILEEDSLENIMEDIVDNIVNDIIKNTS